MLVSCGARCYITPDQSYERAQRLIAQARRLYMGESLLGDLDTAVYALDSTTIDLCLSCSHGRISGQPERP